MEEAMKPLVNLMEKTDKVRLVSGSGTDLTFSIKDIPGNSVCRPYEYP